MLYFDHNATHPLSETAKRAWLDAVEKFPGNPSSPHRLGQRADAALQNARERLAAMLGCGADEIVFTSGATESNNLAVHHFAWRDAGEGWCSGIEHPSMLEAVTGRFPARFRLIPPREDGRLSLEWLAKRITEVKPRFLGLMAANNETGVIQPFQHALTICRDAGVPLVCDATQWIGKLPARDVGLCDFVTASGHKFGAPRGVGFLKGPRKITAMLKGGPQEDWRRAGTENVSAILSMVAALEERETAMRDGALRERVAWRDEFENDLLAALPGARVLGAGVERLWNTVAVIMPEQPDCRRRWVVVMDKLGLAVSTGSACASGKEKPSHVLTAMGVSPSDAGRALRFSAGWETTRDDWRALLDGVKSAAREMGVPAA
jgi:cysteine desulfurase